MTKIVAISTLRVVKQGDDRGSTRLYEALPYGEGYPVYKVMPQPKKNPEDIETFVNSLDELWAYIARGHRSRFICKAAAKPVPSVLGIEEGSFLLEVAKS